MVLRVTDDRDRAAVGANDLAFGDGVDGVVGPLRVEVGFDGEEQFLDRGLVEDGDEIDAI